MFTRRTLLAPLPAIALGSVLGACGNDATASDSPTESSSTEAEGPGRGGAGGLQTFTAEDLDTSGENGSGANTGEVVAAFEAFLNLLSTEQQSSVSYDFSDNQARQTWSNYPAFAVPRNGIGLGTLNDAAKEAALTVVETMLGEQGYQQVQDILTADDWLADNSSSGQDNFGAGNYYLAVFGTPSTSEAFQIQFGGHHIARNFTYLGDTASVTPHFTGTEPKSFTASDGTTVAPMARKADAMFAVFDSLSAEQVVDAELDDALEDLVMGPGVDTGEFPISGGLLGSALSDDQRQLVLSAISAWSGDAASDLAVSLVATYQNQLDETYVAFSNSFEVDADNTYVRIDGPRVWIELINTQSQSTDGVHYHSVYRDKADDYGSSNPSV